MIDVTELTDLAQRATRVRDATMRLERGDSERLTHRWCCIVPELQALTEALVPGTQVKIDVPIGKIVLIRHRDATASLKFDDGQRMDIHGASIYFHTVEGAEILIAKGGCCDPTAVLRRGSPELYYLLMHWGDIRLLLYAEIKKLLSIWADLEGE